MTRVRYIGLFTAVGLLAATTVLGKQQQPLVQQSIYSLAVDSLVTATNGDIVGLTAALANRGTDSVGGRLDILIPPTVRVLGNTAPKVNLVPGGKLYLPVKLQMSADAAAGQYPLTIRWVGPSGEVLASAQTALIIQPKRAVWLQALHTNELMRQVGDSLSIAVSVRNAGNAPERLRLVVSLPNQQGGRRFSHNAFELQAAADTTLIFGYLIDRELIRLERFTVNIAGMYSNDEVFGNTTVTVQNASASRRYEDPTRSSANLWSYQHNYVQFMARNPFTDNRAWQLNGQGSYQLAQGKLDFSAFAYQWGTWSNAPVLNNTWLNFERNNNGITLGNITENLETFVNGRGVKVYFSDSLKSEHMEAGLVDRTFDLLGSDYRADFGNGFTAYFRTRLGEGVPERKRYIGTAIYERLPIDNSESVLYMNTFDLVPQALKDKIQLVADFGPAITRPIYGAATDDEYRPSVAAGIQLHTNLARYAISSTNYYSTGYYPGIRRGALQLNQRISRAIKRTSVWASYSHYRYAPRYFESQPFYRNDLLMSRAELGLSVPLTDFMSLSLVPLHEYEKGNYYFGSTTETPTMDLHSYRLNSTLNWRSRNYRQYAYLQLESGTMQSSLAAGREWQLRANLSYNYAWFNLNANLQRGNFSLIEAANNWYFGREQAYRTGASASARHDFVDKRLQTEAGLSYYNDSFSGQNWTGNARVQYAVTKKTAFFLLGQVYRYHYPAFGGFLNSNIQLGIHQTLPTPATAGTTVKRGNIELFLYQDANNNGVYDEGDQPAANTMVMMNNTVFITGNDGKVSYSRVPYGTQQLNVPVQQGWYAPTSSLILAGRRVETAIALQRAGTVSGRIRYQFDERISFEVDAVLAGFTITAKSITGHIARTVTDNQGNYVLFLPAGNYEFSIMESTMPQHVYPENPVQQFVVEAGAVNAGPVFILEVEEKKVEVKRFSSPPTFP